MVPDGTLGEQGHPCDMDDLGRPQGRYTESFVSLSLLLAGIQGFLYGEKKCDTQNYKQTSDKHWRN